MKVIVLVDVQGDFIYGPLGSPEAQAIVPTICQRVVEIAEGCDEAPLVLFTKDTHYENYMETQEGRNLPVSHCVWGTSGWSIAKAISSTIDYARPGLFRFYSSDITINSRILKETFGSMELAKLIASLSDSIDEVIFMGVCTDICVVSNVLLTKAYAPEVLITVDASCCAGVTPEKHAAALETMKSCQVNVINE